MRKIFLIALFALCAIEGFSQRYTPFQGYGFSARRLKADSVSIVPSDTVINKAANSVAIFNGRVYFQNGTRWQDISYDLPINVRDSISALYPLLYNSSTGVLSADTGRNAASIATGGVVNKVKDSLAASIVLRLLISDTASMLSPYLRKVDTASISNRIDLKLNISDTASMLLSYRNTLNAVQVNKLNISDTASMLNNYRNTLNTVQVNKLNLSDSSLYATRGRLYKVADSLGSVISSVSADSLVFSTKAYRQKGVDSVQANLAAGLALKLNISDTSSMLSPYYRTALANATIVQRITDSLRSLVRLRASGSGGIQLQNSVGTNVADFGIANTTNGSIAGGWNIGGNLAVTGTSGFTGKATFTDSIVGVNQRLSGNIQAATYNGSALGSYAFRSSGLAELSGATFVGSVGINTAPFYPLHVSRSSAGVGLQIENSTTYAQIRLQSGGTNQSSYLTFNPTGTGSAIIQVNDADRLAITNAGNVGIQNPSPNALLTVGNRSGNATHSGDILINQASNSLNSVGGLEFKSDGSGNGYGFKIQSIFDGNSAYDLTFQSRTNIATWTERVRIASTGAATFSSSVTAASATLSGNLTQNSSTDENIYSIINRQGSSSSLYDAAYVLRTNGTNNWAVGLLGNVLGSTTDFAIRNLGNSTTPLRINYSTNAATFSSSVSAGGALTATAQGNNIVVGVDSSVTSTSYTLVLGDAGYLKRCSNASAITITVPTNASVAFPIGTTIYFSQQGAGKVSVSPATSDVTIQSEGSLLGTAGQHAVIGLIKVNTNRWLLVGNRG